MRATWTTNRQSNSKFSKVPKFWTAPELRAGFDIVVRLQREKLVRSFRTNEPLLIGHDENEREVWCVPDIEGTTTTQPQRSFIVRVMGVTWHSDSNALEKDINQRARLESLGYQVVDMFVGESLDDVFWEQAYLGLREALTYRKIMVIGREGDLPFFARDSQAVWVIRSDG